MDLFYFTVGMVVLLVSGDLLVRAATVLSLRLAVSPAVIGLTIVAFGTSAPELLVGIRAALDGFGGLVLGNIIGSNIANILLILGFPALIINLVNQDESIRKNYLISFFATILFVFFVWFGALTYIHGIIFLLIFFIFVIGNVFKANQTQRVESNQLVKAQPNKGTLFRTVGILLIGLVGLPFGATWVILGATGIATVLGISEEVIGLTLVAVGTSLPELSTSILSALRKEPELLMGSIIGSNIFNVLCIGGVTSIINPLNFFGATKLESLFVLVAVTLILAPFIFLSRSINKIWGVTFLVAYVVYLSKLL